MQFLLYHNGWKQNSSPQPLSNTCSVCNCLFLFLILFIFAFSFFLFTKGYSFYLSFRRKDYPSFLCQMYQYLHLPTYKQKFSLIPSSSLTPLNRDHLNIFSYYIFLYTNNVEIPLVINAIFNLKIGLFCHHF